MDVLFGHLLFDEPLRNKPCDIAINGDHAFGRGGLDDVLKFRDAVVADDVCNRGRIEEHLADGDTPAPLARNKTLSDDGFESHTELRANLRLLMRRENDDPAIQ